MIYDRVRGLLPAPLRRYVMHFETAIEDAVADFAATLASGARLLDAGAGEGNYRRHFAAQRYYGFDLGVGDAVMPAVKAHPGFHGIWLLSNRETHKSITITLWETVADMHASEESGHFQEQIAKIAHLLGGPVTVEEYEVRHQE